MAGAIVRVLCLASLAASAGAADAVEPLPLYYFDRPPYVQKVSRSGEVGGLTATPAAQAFRAAGLAFRWTLLPTVRQLVTLKDSQVPACAVGWFKNPERELQFKFTKPIYRDGPTVALARSDFHAVAPTLIDTLRQPGLSVLVKDGFSYGPLIDGMLLLARPEKVVTSVDGVAMVSMIGAQRASFMFAAEEEATYLLEQAGVPANALKLVHFADVPPGERRYLLCSKATPDEVIERLNKAITAEFP